MLTLADIDLLPPEMRIDKLGDWLRAKRLTGCADALDTFVGEVALLQATLDREVADAEGCREEARSAERRADDIGEGLDAIAEALDKALPTLAPDGALVDLLATITNKTADGGHATWRLRERHVAVGELAMRASRWAVAVAQFKTALWSFAAESKERTAVAAKLAEAEAKLSTGHGVAK